MIDYRMKGVNKDTSFVSQSFSFTLSECNPYGEIKLASIFPTGSSPLSIYSCEFEEEHCGMCFISK